MDQTPPGPNSFSIDVDEIYYGVDLAYWDDVDSLLLEQFSANDPCDLPNKVNYLANNSPSLKSAAGIEALPFVVLITA